MFQERAAQKIMVSRWVLRRRRDSDKKCAKKTQHNYDDIEAIYDSTPRRAGQVPLGLCCQDVRDSIMNGAHLKYCQLAVCVNLIQNTALRGGPNWDKRVRMATNLVPDQTIPGLSAIYSVLCGRHLLIGDKFRFGTSSRY